MLPTPIQSIPRPAFCLRRMVGLLAGPAACRAGRVFVLVAALPALFALFAALWIMLPA
jgi:hypothetical protein